MIEHLTSLLPIWKFWFLPEKSSLLKQTGLKEMFKKASKVSLHQLLWYLLTLSPIPSTSSAKKTQENTEEDPDDPEPAEKEDIQMEYSLG
jgi:hypothetical protein